MDFKVGDWVRVYGDTSPGGKMVIGIVQYIRSNEINSTALWLETDQGLIDSRDVFERRRDTVRREDLRT